MKKKILIMICVLLSVGLTITGGFKYFSIQKEAQYLATAVPYIKQVIPEISKWDPVLARSHMSAEFMQKTSAENFANIIRVMSKIGALQELGEPHFEEIYAGDKQTVVSYTIKARYATGDAKITLALLDKDGVFKVYRFNVESAALAR